MMIEPEFLFDGKRLRLCSPAARLHWPFLLALADSLGRFEVDLKHLIARAFWSFDPQPGADDVASMLREYERAGLLLIYEADGRKWGQWNLPKQYFPKGSNNLDEVFPAPPKQEACAGENAGSLFGEEVGGAKPPDPFDAWFENEFWPLYPRKVAKKAAKEKARAKGRTELERKQIMAGLKLQLRDMTERERQFIPYPAVWLNQERYNDEPETQEPVTRKSEYPEWNGYQG